MTQHAMQVSDSSTKSGSGSCQGSNANGRHNKDRKEGHHPKFTDEERVANGLCKDFAKGKKCFFGNNCKFNHPETPATPVSVRQTRVTQVPETPVDTNQDMNEIRQMRGEIVKMVDMLEPGSRSPKQ